MFQARILLMLLLLPASILAQQNVPVYFTLVDGTGETTLGKVNGITQDLDGYMWFSDQDKKCITRFDGYTMKSYYYDPKSSNSLGGSYPETIFADRHGIIWVGFYGMGMDRFDPKTETFTHYRHQANNPNSISSDTVSVIKMDEQGNLWVGTAGGLDLIDPVKGIIQHFRHDPADPRSLDYNNVRSICIDNNQTIWVGTGIPWDDQMKGGLNRLDPTTMGFDHFLSGQKVRAIYEDSRGILWVGTLGNHIYQFDRNTGIAELTDIGIVTESPVAHITFIQEDGAGILWFGTFSSGIIKYDPNTKTRSEYGNGIGLVDNSGWQAFTSREGVLWFSTESANLYRMDPARKRFNFHATDGAVQAFKEMPDGTIWVLTDKAIQSFDAKGQKEFYQSIAPWVFNASLCGTNHFLTGADGKNLIAVSGRLMEVDFDRRFIKPAAIDPVVAKIGEREHLTYLYPTDDQHYWMALNSGLYAYNTKTGQKQEWKKSGSIASNRITQVTAMLKDTEGRFWLGAGVDEGLFRINRETESFDQVLADRSINCLLQDSRGNIWAGSTTGLYLLHADSASFMHFNMIGSPINNTDIYGIIEDDFHQLWVSSRSGIFRISSQHNKSVPWLVNLCLVGNGLTKGLYKKANGDILAGAKSNYISFVPTTEISANMAPQIVLRDLKLPDQSPIRLVNDSTIKLNYNQDIFSIGFAGIHFSNPNQNTHLYKLEGYDSDWRRAGAERTAYYFNIPPGHYTFRVRVGNNEDVWAESAVKIIIIPAWWQSNYAKIAAVLLLIAMVYLGMRWRIRQQFKRQLEKSHTDQQLSELKRRSAELEMQALRSQMNPHFIFNSLNSINRFILQNNKSLASEYLTKFSRLIRYILQNSEQTQIPLSNELQALELYLELESVRFEQHFSYSLTVDPRLDTEEVMVPPLIIQPYCENAIWHGLMHKEEKGQLDIFITREGSQLQYIIRDDGIGRAKAKALKSKSGNTHKSMGMHITAGRMDLLRKNGPHLASIKINDLVYPDGAAAGTEVILKIPLRYD